jgi:riboflavin-specific deaminase-like protein
MDMPAADTGLDEATWLRLLAGEAVDAPAALIYAPLRAPPSAPDGCFVVARIAQSLDGRIATSNGASFWISGRADIVHTHRLRALCDAVVVGAGTVRADDPLLTTRHCAGPSPLRVVIDTERRLSPDRRVFRDPPATLLVCGDHAPGSDLHGSAEVLRVPRTGDGADPAAVVAALARRGLRRILIEGGGITVSRFLAAGALDRLHVTVAPVLLGAGVPGFTFPCPGTPDRALRVGWTVHALGDDLLFDIPLHRAKPPMC